VTAAKNSSSSSDVISFLVFMICIYAVASLACPIEQHCVHGCATPHAALYGVLICASNFSLLPPSDRAAA
jgi:hypothetical protein